MKRKNDLNIVRYLLEQIDIIEKYLFNKTEDEFYREDLLKDACYARLLVLGEYAGRVSSELKKEYKEIEWDVIRGARNFYAHAYDALDWTKVWETLSRDIPELKEKLKTIFEKEIE